MKSNMKTGPFAGSLEQAFQAYKSSPFPAGSYAVFIATGSNLYRQIGVTTAEAISKTFAEGFQAVFSHFQTGQLFNRKGEKINP